MQRHQLLSQLKTQVFDLLIIGGGATGAGIALDAASRGLKVALIEKDDFSSGTSSRSTKLFHGGVRYLELAVKKLDRTQFNLVRDALKERALLLQLAPHLSRPLGLITPLYKWWQVPYYWIGLKIYDWLAGKRNLKPSSYLTRKKTLARFPHLMTKKLKGSVLYYDGQFDDARMNVSVVLTALEKGAVALNHVEVLSLIHEDGKLCGAKVLDHPSEEKFTVRAKTIVNATGPFVDHIRKMDNPKTKPILAASSGAHIVLNGRFVPKETGLLIPQTEDGRVLFLLPWLEHTLVGTTDNPATIVENPRAKEEEIQYILRHVEQYYDTKIPRHEVLSSWSGLRPLVFDPKHSDSAHLARDHVLNLSSSGLITIAGGKWTTYRKMAEDTVDQVIQQANLHHTKPCQTENLPLIGANGFEANLGAKLTSQFGLEADQANHLAQAYGAQAISIAENIQSKSEKRLVPEYPYTPSEVRHIIHHELAYNAVDILARRIRLTFLDMKASLRALPQVLSILAEERKLSSELIEKEKNNFLNYLGLETMPNQLDSSAKSSLKNKPKISNA